MAGQPNEAERGIELVDLVAGAHGWAAAINGLDRAAVARRAEHAQLLGFLPTDGRIAAAGVRSARAADRRPVDVWEGRLQGWQIPDLQHGAGPGDAVRVPLVVPPLQGRALYGDALPAVGLEDR